MELNMNEKIRLRMNRGSNIRLIRFFKGTRSFPPDFERDMPPGAAIDISTNLTETPTSILKTHTSD